MNGTPRISSQLKLFLCVQFAFAITLITLIATPTLAIKDLCKVRPGSSSEAIHVAEEGMRLSGRAGALRYPIYGMDIIYFGLYGWFAPSFSDPFYFAKWYAPKATAWKEVDDHWDIFFPYNKLSSDTGCKVQVWKTGGYNFVFDPETGVEQFAHKI